MSSTPLCDLGNLLNTFRHLQSKIDRDGVQDLNPWTVNIHLFKVAENTYFPTCLRSFFTHYVFNVTKVYNFCPVIYNFI